MPVERRFTANTRLRLVMDEQGLTEQRLAEDVNDAILQLEGELGTLSDRHVRRWLSGEHTRPHPRYLRALEHTLGTTGDQLGFGVRATHRGKFPPLSAPQEAPVLRREFVLAASGALLDIALAPLPDTGRVGLTDVTRIRDSLRELHAVDDKHGGTQLAGVAEDYVRQIHEAMSRCSYGPSVEKALYITLGEISASAGWFAFDGGDPERAQRNYDAALRSALLAGDRLLQARVWSYMARQVWEQGRGNEAISIARAALDVTRHHRDPRLGALLHARLALGYGATGQSARCGTALARAEALLDRASDQAPAWLAFCGPGEILGAGAMAYVGLGQPGRAVQLEEEGITLLPDQFQRNVFAKLVHLAACQLLDRRLEEAVATASRALDVLPNVDCPRWAVQLDKFRTDLDTRLPAAAEFAERYDVTITRRRGD